MLAYLLLVVAFVRAAVGGRAEVVAENLVLRQQLAVLTRQTGNGRGRTVVTRCPGCLPGCSGRAGVNTWPSSGRRR